MQTELRSEDAATRVVVHVENVGEKEGDGAPMQSKTYQQVNHAGEYWACVRCGRLAPNEAIARRCCATSFPCACGGRIGGRWLKCETCRDIEHAEKYAALPRREWDGEESLARPYGDEFFWSADELQEWLENAEVWITLEELQVVFCEPQRPRPVDLYSCFEDILPDGADVPEGLGEMEKKVNDWMQALPPTSYTDGREAPTLESLRAHLWGPWAGEYKGCHNFNPEDVCDYPGCPFRLECVPKQKAS